MNMDAKSSVASYHMSDVGLGPSDNHMEYRIKKPTEETLPPNK